METNLTTKLQNKEYREAFIASLINIELPFQVRALREERGWTQSQLAEKAGMLQPRISAVETPGKGKLNLETLLRLASAFDIGLIVRFALFTEVIKWVDKFSPDTFSVKSFDEDMRSFIIQEQSFQPKSEKQEEQTPAGTVITTSSSDISTTHTGVQSRREPVRHTTEGRHRVLFKASA
jgi:transcriptional regulator with XRE-family HTH domain